MSDCTPPRHPVRIHSDNGIVHTVEIGGHPVQDMIEALSLDIDARTRRPVLTLRLVLIGLLDTETKAVIRLNNEVTELLKAIGWTPPEYGNVP